VKSPEVADALQWFKEHLDDAIARCCDNAERRIGHGNLRHEYSRWSHDDETDATNIAVIYETPGGSTTQINVVFEPESACFSCLSESLEEKVESRDPSVVLRMVLDHISSIPDKREHQLQRQIDHWVGRGMSRSELFAQLNKLLQEEFLGGRLTTGELKQGIKYAISHYS
jgi:hypothetical protein